MNTELFTIGHSNLKIKAFVDLLVANGIDVLADVRTHPISPRSPHFTKLRLSDTLGKRGIHYFFLGKELGARSDNPRCYLDGKIRFNRLAGEAGFQAGLEKVGDLIENHRVALMCAERDPLKCHRAILVCRHLRSSELSIRHIHVTDESIENHSELEQRLVKLFGIRPDLIRGERQCIEEAYDRQGEKIAHLM